MAEDLDHCFVLGMDFITKCVVRMNLKEENIVLENGQVVPLKLSEVGGDSVKIECRSDGERKSLWVLLN